MRTIEDIQGDFELLDDWEDRYRYVIELGRELPPMPSNRSSAMFPDGAEPGPAPFRMDANRRPVPARRRSLEG